MSKAGVAASCALLLGLASMRSVYAQTSPATATPSPGDKAIKYRQAVMTLVGATFGPLGDVIKGNSQFNAADVSKRTGRLSVLAPMAAEAFPDISKTGQTKAKPEVWGNRAEFDKDMKTFVDAAAALDAQVRRDPSNSDAFKTAFGDVGQSCKSCHDDFRQK